MVKAFVQTGVHYKQTCRVDFKHAPTMWRMDPHIVCIVQECLIYTPTKYRSMHLEYTVD